MLKLLTFDLDNTLWETDPLIDQAELACQQWIEQHHPAIASATEIHRLNRLKAEVNSDHPTLIHRLSDFRREVLRRAYLQIEANNEQAVAFAEAAFQVFFQARSKATFYAGALESVQELAEAYQLIALTNGNADLTIAGISQYFDEHFSAENIGQPKPHPAMFEAALKHAQLPASQAVHIGDHQQQDIVAAKQLGFYTVWVNLIDAEWQQAEQPDEEIQHLSQLPAAIAAIQQRATSNHK